MGFVQIVEYRTNRHDEVRYLIEEWVAATEGKRTAARGLMCTDRDQADRHVQIVEFPSYEEAMRNSELPETSAFAQRLAELCDGPPTFRNLDLHEVFEAER